MPGKKNIKRQPQKKVPLKKNKKVKLPKRNERAKKHLKKKGKK